MRVIDRRLSMETTQQTSTFKRRSFFWRLLGGVTGGWIAGNLFSGFAHITRRIKNDDIVQVHINPLAIPRATRKGAPHGE
jgi:hypothetical protein